MQMLPQVLLCLLTAALTYLATRGKQLAEIDKIKAEKAKIDNEAIQEVIDMWRGLVEGLTEDVKDLTQEVGQLRTENKQLKAEMQKLEKLLNEKTN